MFVLLVALSLLVIGVFLGFIASIPPGPINLLIANHCISNKKLAIIPFIAGIILADDILAFLAFKGYETFLEGNTIGLWVSLLGGGLVIVFGAIGIFAAFKKEKNVQGSEVVVPKTVGRASTDFLKGVALCGLNPGLLLFWVSVTSLPQVLIEDTLGQSIELNFLFFSVLIIGITFGEIFWFAFFIKVLTYGAKKFGDNILFYMRVILSGILVLIGFYVMIFEGILKI